MNETGTLPPVEEERSRPSGRTGRPRSDAPSRRDVILDAALALFIERGLGATTMGEVAARAGASKATLYKLFADTEALFQAALVREVERRRAAITGALTESDLPSALAAAAYAMLDALDSRAVELFRLVIAESGRQPALGQGFYAELVETAARPIGLRLERDLGCDTEVAHLTALQFVGSIKEPLFYPRLMGVEAQVDATRLIERAVRMVLASSE